MWEENGPLKRSLFLYARKATLVGTSFQTYSIWCVTAVAITLSSSRISSTKASMGVTTGWSTIHPSIPFNRRRGVERGGGTSWAGLLAPFRERRNYAEKKERSRSTDEGSGWYREECWSCDLIALGVDNCLLNKADNITIVQQHYWYHHGDLCRSESTSFRALKSFLTFLIFGSSKHIINTGTGSTLRLSTFWAAFLTVLSLQRSEQSTQLHSEKRRSPLFLLECRRPDWNRNHFLFPRSGKAIRIPMLSLEKGTRMGWEVASV